MQRLYGLFEGVEIYMEKLIPIARCIQRVILSLFVALAFFVPNHAAAVIQPQTEISGTQRASEQRAQRNVHIIRLKAEPVATYAGGVPGYAATSPRATGALRLELDSAAVEAYRAYLRGQRANSLVQMGEILGRHLVPVRTYDLSFNGIAVRLNAAEAAQLGRVGGVQSVTRDAQRQLQRAGSDSTFSEAAILNLVKQQGGKVVFSFGPGMVVLLLVVALGLFSLALFTGQRRRKRAPLLLLGGAVLLITAACSNSSSHSTLRIEWPGAENTAPGAGLIRAPEVWFGSGSNEVAGGTMGAGVVVGIIDTGISPHSPSFAETGDDGYTHTNPRGRYYGVCDPSNVELYNPNFRCNNKLIGAWAFAQDNPNPVDFGGHGSHVAATAAGSFVEEAIIHTPSGLNLSASISGVAPHANIIAYNVVDANGDMSMSAIMAAIEQALEDEVDVINYSIGSPGTSDPWAEDDTSDMQAFLGAREAGVWVATSAGNAGPEDATLGDPSGAPWLNVVASSTHDVVYQNNVTLSGSVEGLGELNGLGLSLDYGPAQLVYGGDYGDPLCEGSFSAEFNGEIIICDRGENARVEKGQNVKKNGGGGMILAEVDAGDATALMVDAHYLPATHISQPDGDKLKGWLQECQTKGEELQAALSGTLAVSDPNAADIISAFSSRGFNSSVPSVIKPDMAAPGSSIFAPVVDGLGYALLDGTSMASPHVAGALALLKAQHPTWTPAQAQSALMTTAKTNIRRNSAGDPATPFDMGAGRIDVFNAMVAALVLDESGAGYRNANPEFYWTSAVPDKGDPAAINMPSLGQGACVARCEWARILTNVSAQSTSWQVEISADADLNLEVEPRSFNLASGQQQILRVYADSSATPLEEWAFGHIFLRERNNTAPDAHLPVAVRSMAYKLPELWEIETTKIKGSQKLYRFETASAANITTCGLQAPIRIEERLEEDPTPRDYTNGDGGVFFHHFEIPQDAVAFLIDVDTDEAMDLDLYVGRDEDYANFAERSAVGGPRERITIAYPEAGSWWIALQNYAGSGNAAGDLFTLQYAIVTGENPSEDEPAETSDTLEITPKTLQSGQVLDLAWDVPELQSGQYWYGAMEVQMLELEQSIAIPVRLGYSEPEE